MSGTDSSTTTRASFTSGTISLTINATVPGAPVIGTATAGNAQAQVSFTAPASNGGSAITGYTVTSTPGAFTAAGSASPITVTGLTNGAAYTFRVTATNSVGTGSASAASNSVTPSATPVAATQAIASTTLTAGHAATAFTPVIGSGGTAPLTYSVSPGLPSGLSMASGTGVISGTPSVTSSATTYTVTVTDANSATATATFSLIVAGPAPVLAVAASGSPASVVPGNDITYSIALTVSTGTATNASLSDPYAFKHGHYTAEAIARQRKISALIRVCALSVESARVLTTPIAPHQGRIPRRSRPSLTRSR